MIILGDISELFRYRKTGSTALNENHHNPDSMEGCRVFPLFQSTPGGRQLVVVWPESRLLLLATTIYNLFDIMYKYDCTLLFETKQSILKL